MPCGKSEEITDKEFYTGVARLLDVPVKQVKTFWENGFNEFIVREIFFRGSCRLPGIGSFRTKKIAESFQVQKNIEGKEIVYKVPERDVPIFDAHDNFINDINMHGVTKAYRKRLKKNALTHRDYLRQIRAETLGVEGSISAERMRESKENFHAFLKDRREGKK